MVKTEHPDGSVTVKQGTRPFGSVSPVLLEPILETQEIEKTQRGPKKPAVPHVTEVIPETKEV